MNSSKVLSSSNSSSSSSTATAAVAATVTAAIAARANSSSYSSSNNINSSSSSNSDTNNTGSSAAGSRLLLAAAVPLEPYGVQSNAMQMHSKLTVYLTVGSDCNETSCSYLMYKMSQSCSDSTTNVLFESGCAIVASVLVVNV
jgi:hypothetical protein